MKRLIVALVIFELLCLGDVATSLVCLDIGATELNPIYYAQGFQTFLLLKLGFSLSAMPVYIGVYTVFKKKFPNYTKAIWLLLLLLIGAYILIVANNIYVIIRQVA